MIPVNGTPKFASFYKSLDPNSKLFKKLDTLLDALSENPKIGELIEFKRIPKPLKKRYSDLDNLLVVRIDMDWRLLYSLKGFPNDKSIYVIDAIPHKEYDKLFGY